MAPLAEAGVSGAGGAAPQPEATLGGAPAEAVAEQQGDHVVVFYFHRTLRCYTCLGMEAAAHEAVYGEFLDRVNAGTLEWRAVNFELPENVHFEKEYDLEGSSLVFAETGDKKVVRWEKIEGIWNHAGHPEELRPYVGQELRRFLAHGATEDSTADVGADEAGEVSSDDSSARAGGTP